MKVKLIPPATLRLGLNGLFQKYSQQQKEASFSNEFVFLISPKIALRDG